MKPGESLSQEEIDALLTAVHSGTVAVSAGGGQVAARGALPYNFRRPSRLSKEQIRGLFVVHEDFAKLASASLSAMFRTMVDIEVEAVEQIAYSEYVLAIAQPTCSFVFNMEPLKGGAVLELNPHLAFVMMERLLGGVGQGLSAPRDLTEIERAVIERVGLRAMVDLQQAWQQVGAFVFRVLNLETNPQLIQVTAPNEVILVATLRVKLGETVASITLGYPYLLLEPVVDRMGGQRWQTSPTSGPTAETRAVVLRELYQSAVHLRAFLGGAQVTVRDVLALRPGQVLRLDARRARPVTIHLNDVPKYAGRLGTRRTHLAVEILGQIDEEGTPL